LGCILAGLLALGSAVGQEGGAGYVSPAEPENAYLDAIDRIEAESGPYATELSDLYLGLGQSLLDRGDFEEARDAFHRGVMVMRVNSGPNSPEQTNHLYLIANIETLLGEDKTADKILDNIYFINSTYYGEDSPAMLPVLDRMYEWYQMARPPGSDLAKFDDYARTVELTEMMVEINEAAKGPDHPDTATAYRRLGEAEFQVVRFMTKDDMYVAMTGGTLETHGGDLSATDHYDSACKAFRKYLESVETNPSSTPLERATALANMGDWYLVLDRTRIARRHYREAWQALAQDGRFTELADSYLGQPKPAHFVYPEPGFLEDLPAEFRTTSIVISMTVTSLGGVRYVEVLNAPEGLTEDDLGEIKRHILKTPFRPAMKAGEVVTTKDFIWQFEIASQGRTS
jgi:tetratricopeptide (TPR) repeat protein